MFGKHRKLWSYSIPLSGILIIKEVDNMIHVDPNHLQPTNPKGYTERQYKILTCKIPYEETSGYDYRHLKEKAIQLRDFAIAEWAETLLAEKKKDCVERNRDRARNRYRNGRPDIFYPWEIDLLEGRRNYLKYQPLILKMLYDKAVRMENEEYAEMANRMFLLRTGASADIMVTDPIQAREIIDTYTVFPIDWPERWYK